MRLVDADHVRATIAAQLLGPLPPVRVGAITLHAHQSDAVARLRQTLREHHGALLADDVGLGKTYVGLTLATEYRHVVVIAPASVRSHWLDCARHAGVDVAFHSMESLSRRGAPSVDPDLVIIDEAHHFRTAGTLRFGAARSLCANAHVLLMSATPVQNDDLDLQTILSLFLGSRGGALSNADVARFIVRRMAHDLGAAGLRLPEVAPPRWLSRVEDVDCLDRILAIPSAVAPVDGKDGGALVSFALIRQWASSRAALVAALRRRVARGLAMLDALRAGRLPSRAELASWCHTEGSQQLFFAELVSSAAGSSARDLLTQVERHLHGLRELLEWIKSSSNPDPHRAALLLSLLQQHSGERIIAFSEYTDTVSTLFRLTASAVQAAMLTHSGGRIASGPISRREILERFGAGAGMRMHRRDRIDLLLTTDVLSEGVNLPDASVVVHLDLAWNPARLEQRIGRLRRVDSLHRSVAVYLMPPPAPAERMLRVQHRLRIKHALAHRSLGVAGAILPGGATVGLERAAVRPTEHIAALLQSWRRATPLRETGIAAAVRATEWGAIACARVEGSVTLLAVEDIHVNTDVTAVERLVAAAGGEGMAIDQCTVDEIRGRIERFLLGQRVSRVVDLPAMHVARARRTLLQRADSIARRSSREMRPRIAPLLQGVRAAARSSLSAGAERALHELATADLPDDHWLRAINEFAAMHARTEPAPRVELLALLILRPN